ncbi:MAG: transcriptional regulator [Nodularia sp. (in: Bacteria)]|nr:MAG: transcriptional regulator [Nodularia sp. (in: cyanobacteria)]
MASILNKEKYTQLLTETLPRVIDTEEEYERLLNEVSQIMVSGENMTAEEAEVLQLLAVLIEQYEDEHYKLKTATPIDILQELMLVRGLKQKDLLEVFGSKGIASEVINGKRSISKNQAKALGQFFHVSPALFL